MIAAVSFDLDGTLGVAGWRVLRVMPGLLRARGALGALLRSVEAARHAPRQRHLDAALVSAAAARCGAAEAAVAAVLREELDGRFSRALRGASAAAGVCALLEACDAVGLPRVVVSDHPALEKLRVLGLEGGWSAVVSCRALGALKPAPDGLWAAAAMLGVPLAGMLHVGDRWETDGRAAAAAGCQFAHISEAVWWASRLAIVSEP